MRRVAGAEDPAATEAVEHPGRDLGLRTTPKQGSSEAGGVDAMNRLSALLGHRDSAAAGRRVVTGRVAAEHRAPFRAFGPVRPEDDT